MELQLGKLYKCYKQGSILLSGDIYMPLKFYEVSDISDIDTIKVVDLLSCKTKAIKQYHGYNHSLDKYLKLVE